MAGSVHIKLEYPEAVAIKKDALLLEASLLKIVGHIRNYDSLKKKEFILKSKIKKDAGELKGLVSAAESLLPREEIKYLGDSYKTEEIKESKRREIQMRKETAHVKERKMTDIEHELEDIKHKLSRLD